MTYAHPKLTLAITTVTVCSIMLKGPGFKKFLRPNVLKCRVASSWHEFCPSMSYWPSYDLGD